MGQAVTKAASRVVVAPTAASAASASAASAANPSIVGPPSSSAILPRRGLAPSENDDDVAAVVVVGAPPPSSTPSSSLAVRGRAHMARIAADVAFAASADDRRLGAIGGIVVGGGGGGRRPGGDGGGGGGGGVPELPPDLLRFLNDAGPLRRVVDREYTSPRVYDALTRTGGDGNDDDGNVRDEHARMANGRVRRRMPLVQQRRDRIRGGGRDDDGMDVVGKEEGATEDGTTTERTTNFSRVDRTKTKTTSGIGVTRMDCHIALTRLGGMRRMGGGRDAEWKAIVDDECDRIFAASSLFSSSAGVEHEGGGRSSADGRRDRTFDELRDAALFGDSLRYIGLPVLMRDAEGDIIGVWHRKAEDMGRSSGLRKVSNGSVEFVMLKEDEDVVVG